MVDPPKPARQAGRRPLHLLDLMALVAAVALTLISPAIMRAIIPANSYHNWDRRQYVTHLAALVMIWWTMTLIPLMLFGAHRRLSRVIRSYGCAAILAPAMTALFLVLRQAPAVILRAAGVGFGTSGGCSSQACSTSWSTHPMPRALRSSRSGRSSR